MTKINDGGPAFPRDNLSYGTSGMSLRDWIAGHCLAGAFAAADDALLVGDGETIEQAMAKYWASVAETSFIAADAFIASREAGQ